MAAPTAADLDARARNAIVVALDQELTPSTIDTQVVAAVAWLRLNNQAKADAIAAYTG